MKLQVKVKGSAYSGNYGHAGIPGHQGGSAPSSASAADSIVNRVSDEDLQTYLREDIDNVVGKLTAGTITLQQGVDELTNSWQDDVKITSEELLVVLQSLSPEPVLPSTDYQVDIDSMAEKALSSIPARLARTSVVELTKMCSDDSYQDDILAELSKDLGYDRLPQLCSKQELDAYRKTEVELFRGVESADYVEQYKSGKLFVGRGMRGNGTYTAYGRKGRSVAKEYAGLAGDAGLLRMTLKPTAKIVSFSTVKDVAKKLKSVDLSESEMYILNDYGRLAALMGYDAICYSSTEYMIVLNRGMVRVQE